MSEVVMSAFQAYLEHEISKRNLSYREFALMAGVSATVISRLLDKRTPTIPELTTLSKIAGALGADLLVLVGMIYPDSTTIDVEARQLARQISHLSKDERDFIDAFLLGRAMKAGKQAP